MDLVLIVLMTAHNLIRKTWTSEDEKELLQKPRLRLVLEGCTRRSN